MKVKKIGLIPCPYCGRIQYTFSDEERKNLEKGEGDIKCDFCNRVFNLKELQEMMNL